MNVDAQAAGNRRVRGNLLNLLPGASRWKGKQPKEENGCDGKLHQLSAKLGRFGQDFRSVKARRAEIIQPRAKALGQDEILTPSLSRSRESGDREAVGEGAVIGSEHFLDDRGYRG